MPWNEWANDVSGGFDTGTAGAGAVADVAET